MAVISLWNTGVPRGFGPIEIQPGAEVRFDVEASVKRFVPNRLALTDECRGLQIVEVGVADRRLLERVSAQRYTSPLVGATDGDLLEQIRNCFRHADHSREEYLKVIDIFRPSMQGALLPICRVVEPAGRLWITLRNPTALPVRAMGIFEGRELRD